MRAEYGKSFPDNPQRISGHNDADWIKRRFACLTITAILAAARNLGDTMPSNSMRGTNKRHRTTAGKESVINPVTVTCSFPKSKPQQPLSLRIKTPDHN